MICGAIFIAMPMMSPMPPPPPPLDEAFICSARPFWESACTCLSRPRRSAASRAICGLTGSMSTSKPGMPGPKDGMPGSSAPLVKSSVGGVGPMGPPKAQPCASGSAMPKLKSRAASSPISSEPPSMRLPSVWPANLPSIGPRTGIGIRLPARPPSVPRMS